MKRTLGLVALIALIGGVTTAAAGGHGGGLRGKPTYASVQKILDAKCTGCHGARRSPGGIGLTSYEAIMKGGREGVVVKAGDPKGSVLVQALYGKGHPMMPPKGGPLAAGDIKTIEDWIKAGAKKA